MSSSRITAFMISFVLPVCYTLDEKESDLNKNRTNGSTKTSQEKNKVASRILVSLVTSLAKTHPKECVQSIFLPLLLRQHHPDAGTGNAGHASVVQCELISRIVKQTHLPQDCLSCLASELVSFVSLPSLSTSTTMSSNKSRNQPSITAFLTDQMLSVFTSIVQQKPNLSKDTIEKICNVFLELLQTKQDKRYACTDMSSSLKFSSFFHAFVIQYGEEIKQSGRLEPLLVAAEGLKTLLKKSIILALRRFF